MATRALPALQMFTAIAEVMTGALGANRRVATGLFASVTFVSLDRDGKQTVALSIRARNGFEIALTPIGDNGASPGGWIHDEQIKNVAVVIRGLTPTAQVACSCEAAFGKPQDQRIVTARYEAQAQLLSDLEDAVEALYAGNLERTSGGADTGIISGILSDPLGGNAPTYAIGAPDWEARFIEWQITARAVVAIEQNS